jgi:hypothetical protein
VIQDEQALLEPVDYEVMARIYQWQAMAADPNLDPQYRAHYRRRILAVREELNAILVEINRIELDIAREEAFYANQA